MSSRETWSNYLLGVSLALVLLPVALFAVGVAGFATRGPLGGGADLAVAAVLAGGAVWLLCRSWRGAAAVVVTAVVLHAGAWLMAGSTYDSSWDGLEYHQEAVMRLAAGWNPLTGPPVTFGYKSVEEATIQHYPKGAWVPAAEVLLAGQRIEAGKVFNFSMIVAAGTAVAAMLLRIAALSPPVVLLISLLAALNPVAVVQSWTYYIDGLVAATLTVIVAALADYYALGDRRSLVLLIAAVALLANLKFTGPPTAAFLLCGVVGMLWFSGRWRTAWRFGAVAAVAGMVSVGALGYEPYTKNLMEHGHPFYPLAGSDPVDIMTIQRPENLHRLNRFERFVVANFSESANPVPQGISQGPTRLKFPGRITWEERRAGAYPDLRGGGFGPLMGLALVVVVLLTVQLVFLRGGEQARLAPLLGLATVVFASIFITAEGWWARYAPQAWLVPLLIAAGGLAAKPRLVRVTSQVLLCIISLNVAFIGVCAVFYEVKFARETRQSLIAMKDVGHEVGVYFGRFPQLARRLREAGIAFVEIQPDDPRAASEHHFIPSAAWQDAFWVE